MRLLIGLASCLALALALSVAAQVSDLPDLPQCVATTYPTAGWHEVSFEQFRLTVPAGVKPAADGVVEVGHGGQRWAGSGINVSLALGYYGPHSFDGWSGTRCRADVAGHPALMIERATEAGAIVAVWSPEIVSRER